MFIRIRVIPATIQHAVVKPDDKMDAAFEYDAATGIIEQVKAKRRRNPQPEPRPHLQLHRMKLNGSLRTNLMRIPSIKEADDERLPSKHHHLPQAGMA